MLGHGISHGGNKGTSSAGQLDSTHGIFKQSQIFGALPWNMIVDHVVSVRSGAAGAVATQRAVYVGREMIGEIWDLKTALQTSLPAHDAHFPNSSLLDVALDRGVKEDRQRVRGGGQWGRLLQRAGRRIAGGHRHGSWLPAGSPDGHLGAWLQTFQLLGFTEGFMVLKLVFNFVLGKEKLQPAFVAVINISLLVPHVMLLECIAIFEDLQAIRAEQMPGVLMDHPKMDIYLRVE